MPELAEWDSFYVIVGAAAGALIGLEFVVITLISDKPSLRDGGGVQAFAPPTIVHFCVALFLSAVLRAPWHAVSSAAIIWGVAGLLGAAYMLIVIRRMWKQTVYRPQVEDWLLRVLLPFAAYCVLLLSAIAAPSNERAALFGVGAASLVLLFTGIHNAWDDISYHVISRGTSER